MCLALGFANGCYEGASTVGAGADDSGSGEESGAPSGSDGDGDGEPTAPDEAQDLPPTTAIPRLSRREIEQTIVAVFGIAGAAEQYLPEDPRTLVNPQTGAEEEAFDTHAASKNPSAVFVEGLESMALEVALEFSADHERVNAIAGCIPSGAWDPACLRTLIETLGLRLWRRPLTSDETDALLAAATEFGEEAGHDLAVRMVAQSLLQSPQFAYQSEVGVDTGEGLRRLDNYELVTRVSFLLWGSAPSPELLEAASGSELTDDALRTLAQAAADDPRTDAQMRAFHRLWLRYDEALVTDPELAADMQAESDALLDRVLFEDAGWSTLLTAQETFVTPALAEHYGLDPVPNQPDWVSYGDDGRAGLLSHGSFLSLSATGGTGTLPSRRGAMLAQRILCQTILPPPPDVDADAGVEVEESECKAEAYAVHRSNGSCASCHDIIDPLGMGFERYDGLGRYRELEPGKPECSIAGEGMVAGADFSGPREFAAVLDDTGLAARCGVHQLSRFALRGVTERHLIERLNEAFDDSGQDFRELMVAMVMDPTFRYRKEEAQ